MTENEPLQNLISKIRYVAGYQLHKSPFVSYFSTVGLLLLKLFIIGVIASVKLDFRITRDEKDRFVSELKMLYCEC